VSISPSEAPMRINKYLAYSGVCSRREADALIAAGLVFKNGKRATMGELVLPTDDVEVKNVDSKAKKVYFAVYKPKGMITQRENQKSTEHDVVTIVNTQFPTTRKTKLFPRRSSRPRLRRAHHSDQ
jgi:23S rRNA pseudouridine2604 synthase